MKLIPTLAVAAAASLTVLSPGFAAECGARPPRLAIPDGKTASDDQMKATQAKLTPYATAMSKYLHCLSEEIQAGTAEYKSVTDEWTKQAQAFKDTPAK
jgi:hypothetical protein